MPSLGVAKSGLVAPGSLQKIVNEGVEDGRFLKMDGVGTSGDGGKVGVGNCFPELLRLRP